MSETTSLRVRLSHSEAQKAREEAAKSGHSLNEFCARKITAPTREESVIEVIEGRLRDLDGPGGRYWLTDAETGRRSPVSGLPLDGLAARRDELQQLLIRILK